MTCNGNRDCGDGSDESSSICISEPSLNCTDSEFTCANGQCIFSSYRCDGDVDCHDGSDELMCSPTDPPSCADNQFVCDDSLCIPDFYRCDGQPDCAGDIPADELDCDGVEHECGQGFFNCSNGKCINVHQVCDGDNTCGDSSDEEDCPSLSCGFTGFLCIYLGEPSCIPAGWECDGENDCDDSSDELGCSDGCPSTHFQCTTSASCIPLSSKCDGIPDCDDSSDEYVCPFPPPPVPCRGNQFSCLDRQQCLDVDLLCDGTPDCIDESDEGQLCSNSSSCETNNSSCAHTCHSLSDERSFCSCLPGYRLNSTDFESCNDIDECSHPDSCSQLCSNTDGSFACSCAEGYHLSAIGDCRAGGPEAMLLFGNRVDIRTVSLNGSNSRVLVNHLQYAVSIDYHYRLGYMFWTDLYGDSIHRANLDGTNMTVLIDTGLSAPDGIAVDWVNNKLYWTDAGKSRLEVANLDGTNRRILFSRDVDKPRAVMVDPSLGYVFWTDWGQPAKIERSSMDGAGRVTLHSEHLSWPNALTIDRPARTLYWADAKLHVIESSDIYGRNRRPVLTLGVLHPFALTVFENQLFWSDWNTLSILSITKSVVGANLTRVQDEMLAQEFLLTQNISDVQTSLFYPTDVQVVHPVLQPAIANPCDEEHNQCEYLCLLSAEKEEGYSCVCPTGRRLMEDGRGCEEYQAFLIFARRMELRTISLDVPEINDITLPLNNLSSAVAVDTDPLTDCIFWTDRSREIISSARLDGSNQTILVSSNLDNPDGLSIDWLSRKLYWTNDGTLDSIEVSELDGSNRLVLIRGEIDKPSDIVVHPKAGYMFWAEWGSSPKIQRANLDGSNMTTIVHHNIIRPHGLALDFDLDRLYWCDATRDTIEYVDLNGHGRSLVLKGLNHPYGLAIYGDNLYWTDLLDGVVQVTNKTSGEDIFTLADNLEIVLDIEVFHRQKISLDSHPCHSNNGGCSHICLTRPSQSAPGQLEASCVCPTGLGIMANGKTCFSEVQNYLLFPSDSTLYQVSLDTPILASTTQSFGHFQDTSSVAVDIPTGEVYWTNRLESRIYKASLAPTLEADVVDVVTEVVFLDLITPEVIVLDWIGRMLYWADSGTRFIEVMNLESSTRKVLAMGLDQVTSLALDVIDHTLYFINGGGSAGDVPKIERIAMDGTNRTIIISENLGQPRAVTVDHPPGRRDGRNGRIYWTDAMYGKIESAALDGSDRTFVIEFATSSGVFPFGIAVTADHVYWTDTGTNTLSRRHKTNSLSHSEVVAAGLVDAGHLIAVRKSELEERVHYSHPCETGHHCSHLCLPNLSEEGFSCSCATGIELANKSTCKKAPNHFILLSTGPRLKKVLFDVNTPSGRADKIVVTMSGNFHSPIAIDHILWSEEEGTIFFSDTGRGVISSISMDGTGLTDLFTVGLSSGLAVDWVGRLIYWTDSENGTIEVARLDGTGRKTLIERGLDNPRGIVLHPSTGLMFWTDWGENPAIYRSRMDGSSMVPIVSRDITWPNGIALDEATMRLYWVDAWHDRLETSDINGLFRRTFLANDRQNQENLHHAFDVSIHNGYVYWSDWFHQTLFRKNLVPGRNESDHGTEVIVARDRPYGFTVVDMQIPRPGELTNKARSGPCGERNGGCNSHHLCLPVDRIRRTCACPDELDNCFEYRGVKGQPPPPPAESSNPQTPRSIAARITTTTPASPPSNNEQPTSPVTTSRGNRGKGISNGGPPSALTQALSGEDDLAIIISVAVVFMVVVVTVAVVIFLAYLWLRRRKTKYHARLRREVTLKKLHQLRNPNYIGMSSKEKESDHRDSSTASADSKASLLPKTHNYRNKDTRTASNLYEEKPDVFIMPGQKPAHSAPPKTPDSPPLKDPKDIPHNPESPPPKPPMSPPVKPKPLPLSTRKAPPPVPPKTYISAAQVVTLTVEPKQSNIERAKIVRFDSSVKMEENPPPIPRRGMVWEPPSTMGVVSETASTPEATSVDTAAAPMATRTTAVEDPNVAVVTVAVGDSKDTESVEEGSLEEIVAIIDTTSGNKVGELVPSPVDKTPPQSFHHNQTAR